MFTRYAYFDAEVLDVKGSPVRHKTASLAKVADFENYRTDDGFMYVRIRAISSRVNKNHDGWPSVELAGSPEIFQRHQATEGFIVEAKDGNPKYGFASFIGKPIFVDHNNSNPRKARGVVVDAKFRVLDHKTATSDGYWKSADVDPEHLPAAEVELLLEVDAKEYPKYAKAILDGDLDGFSMGANVEYTKCSHCGKVAHDPGDFCSHVLMKGAHHDFKTADGKRVSRRSYENCYKVGFFEISGVFDPADETALAREVRASAREAVLVGPGPTPEGDAGYSVKPDPLRDDRELEIEAFAHQLMQQYGYGHQEALTLAQDKLNKDRPLPAMGGDGDVYAPKPYDFAASPAGMPPPVDPNAAPPSPFGQGAQDALDETYPQRPVRNNPQFSSTKVAENPLPQEFMTRAPDEIDTLHDDQVCPVCGSELDSETCKVCGYVQPPSEFDNPDLQKSQQIRDEMKQKDQEQALQEQPPNPLGEPSGGGPLTSRLPQTPPSKPQVAASVTNDMRWTPQVHPKTAARINQVEHPVRPTPNQPTSNEPSAETVLSDQTRPVTAAMLTARRLIEEARRNNPGDTMPPRTADGPTPPGDTSPKTRVDVVGVGGVDEASNEAASKADAQVDVTGVGSVGVSDVSADKTEDLPSADRKSDDAGFNTDKNIEEIHTETFGDKDGEHSGVSDPVTNETLEQQPQQDGKKASEHRAYDDKTLEQGEQQGNEPVAQGGSAVQGVQPADPVGNAEQRVNVLEHQTSPSNNSGPTTTWSGTDGNSVLRQQEPVTGELPEWGGVTVPDVQLHTTATKTRMINAMRLAEMEVELSLTPREAKWNRIDELSNADPVKVSTRLETLGQVKTAGLAKIAQARTAKTFPRAFGKQTAAAHDFERIASETPDPEPVSDVFLDSALFSR